MKIVRLTIVVLSTFVALFGRADYWAFRPNSDNVWLPELRSETTGNVARQGQQLVPERSLPIGTTNRLQQYFSQKVTDISISLFQVNDATRNYLSADEWHSMHFIDYQEMLVFLREKISVLGKGFNASNYNRNLSIWLAVGTAVSGSIPFHSFTEFSKGTRSYPSGFVSSYEPELNSYLQFDLGGVEGAKIIALDGDFTITDWDTRKDPSEYRDVWIDSGGNLLIHRDFCTEATAGLEIIFQVWYPDGTTQAFNSKGESVPVPAPHLLIRPKQGGVDVVLKFGPVGRRNFVLEKLDFISTNKIAWKNFTVTDNVMVFTDLSFTNKSGFYRIKPEN